MKNKKIYKNQSGITLVVLAVTIVVLIILGAISIMSLTDDDGAINRALNAKNSSDYKQAKTEVNEEWYSLQMDNRKEEKSNSEMATDLEKRLKDRLKEEGLNENDAQVTYTDDNHPLSISYKGQQNIELELEPNVEPSQDSQDITISQHPQNTDALEEFEATLSVTATATKGTLSYQWFRTSDNTTLGGEKIAGATQSSYSIAKTSKSDEMYYYCEVSSNYSGVTEREKSNTAKLTVKGVIKELTISPAEIAVAAGKTISLNAVTSGETEITYKWFTNSTNSNTGGTEVSGQTSSTFEKPDATTSDIKYYYCQATQTLGSASKTVTSNAVHVTVVESKVTYDYGIDNQTYLAETYSDTGYNINWDNDFTIEATVNVPELGKRYMIVDGYDGSTPKELQVDIYNNQFRVFIGYHGSSSGYEKSAYGSITPNEDIKVTFTWTARTHSYTATAKGATTDKTITDTVTSNGSTYDPTGITNNSLRIGCVDYRGATNVFSPITIKSLKITETQDPSSTLRVPAVNRIGFTFNGWYTAQTGGTQITESTPVPHTEAIYYAQYEDTTGPEITNVSASTTLGTTNYVDVTAIDYGVGIDGYNITSVDQQPTNWNLVTPTNNFTQRIEGITANGTYYVWVKDTNGHVASTTVEVTKVDRQAPLAEITSTNNLASEQTATLTMGDDNGVVQYYWGTQDPSTNSVTWTNYNNSTNATETKTVNDGGEYFLGVKDEAGNITVVSKNFYKTTLNPGSATVDPATIITMEGNSIDLPDPTQVTGNNFDGWFTAQTGGTQATNPYTPTASSTLYAHHSAGQYTVSFAANGGNVNPSSKTVTYGQTYGELPEPTREGYQFQGWNGHNLINITSANNYSSFATVLGNKVYFDASSVSGNVGTNIKVQKFLNNTYVGTFSNSGKTSTGHFSMTFTTDSSYNGIMIRENTNLNDPTIGFYNILENGETYTLSYDIESLNFSSAQGVVSNIQLEEGSTARPYYVSVDTTVTIPHDHTLTAIWRDVTAPTISFGTNGNSTPSQHASTSVTVVDSGSGGKQSTYKYLWTTRTVNVTEADFTGTNSGTFTQGETINLPNNNSGDYYLYIYAEDNEGNSVLTKSNKFVVGNMQPGADIGVATNWSSSGNIITIQPYAITVEFDASNVRSEIHDASRVASVTVNGEAVTVTNGVATYNATENGTYTIAVTDIYGNTWSQTKSVGNVDMTPPTISASNITYGQTLNISIADVGSGTKKWHVTQSATAPTSGWQELETVTTSTTNVSKSGLAAGTWYVWAQDAAGNNASKQITVFKAATEITLTQPDTIIKGNSVSFTARSNPEINGTWYVTSSSSAVTITGGNGETGSSVSVEYTGANAGDTEITVKFEPTDASYDKSSRAYTQTVLAGNYSITSGGVKRYYNTMALALAAIPANGTGTIVQEEDYTDASTVTISDGKNVTFDNNGKILNKTTKGITVNDGTTFTVSGKGLITVAGDINLIQNSGTLNITHTGAISQNSNGDPRIIRNFATFNKTGTGIITASGSAWMAILTDGEDAITTISAGTVSSSVSNSFVMHCYRNSKLVIKDTAKIEGNYGIHLGNTTTNSKGTLEMSGGTITASSGMGIELELNSMATITEGTIIGKTSGVYQSSGTVNIGSISNTFNTNNPVIQGDTYGLSKSGGTWNFYNGILKGGTGDYTGGEPATKRSGYDVKHDTEGNLHTAYLKQVPTLTVASTATVNHDQERTLAITYIGDGALTANSSNSSVAEARIEGSNLIITGGNTGTATVTVSAAEGTNYFGATATCTVTVGTTALSVVDNTQSVVYDGSPHGIDLDIEQSDTTTWYSTSTELDSNNYSTAGSTTMPTRTDVGTTTVNWYVDPTQANPNYSGVKGTSTITVTRADITPTVNIANYTYGGTKSTPSVSGNPGNGTPVYYYNTSNSNTGGTAWTNVTSSTSLSAGDYYMYAEIPATTNYNSAKTPAYKFTIEKKSPTMTLSKTTDTVIDGNTTTFTISYDGDGALSVASSDGTKATATRSGNTVTVKGEDAGTAAITVTAAAGTNYAAIAKYCDVTVTQALYQVLAGSPTYHRTLASAVNAVDTGSTIKVLANTEEADNVTISKNVTLDTNGKTLTRTGNITISSGTTTISGNGTIDKTTTGEAITVQGLLKTSGTPHFIAKGSTIVAHGGTITISSGTVTSTEQHALGCVESGNLTVSGGTVTTLASDNVHSCIYNSQSTTIITGGTISSLNSTIYNGGSGTINISGGTITSAKTLTLKQSTGTSTLSGGTITSNEATAIQITGGTMTASGATINATGENGNGVYVDGGTFNLNSGTINATLNGIITNAGTTNMGDSSVAINTALPAVTANVGLTKTGGTWNFNNGVLKGVEAAYNEYPTAKRDNTDIRQDTETISGTTYKTAYLIGTIPTVTTPPTTAVATRTRYKDANNDVAVIPTGFKVSSVAAEQVIANGLVVIDGNDNEWVWVPANGTTLEYKKHEYETKIVDDTTALADTGNGNWDTYYYRNWNDWRDDGTNETSVAEHGGFYVARYEAGIPDDADFFGNTNGATYYKNDKKNVTTYTPVSKKNYPAWNYISQAKSKTVAAKMYNNSEVKSSLIDGVAWDTITQWIANDGTHDVSNSTAWGNYYNAVFDINGLHALHTYVNSTWNVAPTYSKGALSIKSGDRYETATGITDRNKARNIYDFAGNMYEWTTETGSRGGTVSTRAVVRGGGFYDVGTTCSASFRHGSGATSSCSLTVGFRVVLYLE